jgi:hypothetical protein
VKRPDPDHDALTRMPAAILRAHDREFALMHDREVIAFMPSFKDAVVAGRQRFAPGAFTVQQVRAEPPPAELTPHPQRPDPDFDALTHMPAEFLRQHDRQYVLMHDREVIAVVPSFKDAVAAGRKQFSPGAFSVQQVRAEPVHVGSLAMVLDPSR